MKVKRYVANTVQEAINNVKTELGQDAIIMSTRKIRHKGLMGWFRKPMVEVVAAVDDVIITHKSRDNRFEKNMLKNKSVPDPEKKTLKNLEQKVDAMGEMINKLVHGYTGADKNNLTFPPEYNSYYNLLLENEVEEELAKKLINRAQAKKEKENINLHESIEKTILEFLGIPKPLEIKSGKARTALFLGPTGVGKTTTMAKLAAIYSIQHQKKVGLITADTYRIAAVDQLKIYAQILDIPLSIIYSPEELTDAIDYHKDKDIILIDTAGKSIKDKNQEREISQLLSYGRIDEIYLVVSSNVSYKTCVNIINNYQFLPHYKLLFTKIDEINSYGILLNCCMLSQKPLSYVTTGQDVPDDIDIADPVKIKNHIMGRYKA